VPFDSCGTPDHIASRSARKTVWGDVRHTLIPALDHLPDANLSLEWLAAARVLAKVRHSSAMRTDPGTSQTWSRRGGCRRSVCPLCLHTQPGVSSLETGLGQATDRPSLGSSRHRRWSRSRLKHPVVKYECNLRDCELDSTIVAMGSEGGGEERE
jgi:hypothetical protein